MNCDFSGIQNLVYHWLITSGLKIVVIITVALVLKKVSSIALKKFFHLNLKVVDDLEYEKKLQTLYAIVKSLVNLTIIIVSGILILGELGVNVGPILAAAGVLGVAVGFGSQRLVEDVISGFLILVNDQIRVGDVIQVGDKAGYVEKVDLKMVTLRDLAGNVHFIRNGKIDIVTNMTKDFSYALFDIGVAYKENIERVMDVINQVYDEVRSNPSFENDILEPIEILGLDKFDDSAIVIKARIKTMPIKQWAVSRAFNLILKKKFDEFGIEIPFPQRTLHMVKD